MGKNASRPARWAEATGAARAALDNMSAAMSDVEAAFGDLSDLQGEYQDWLDNLPDMARGSAVEEKLQAITDLDLSLDFDLDLSSIEEALDEVENADLPLGFGRD